jgi:pre-mRNA-splicing factor SYF2
MNARQRKLFELKQKMNQARKANENAIVAERKRMRVRTTVCGEDFGA